MNGILMVKAIKHEFWEDWCWGASQLVLLAVQGLMTARKKETEKT
jgi:hypothetical protein